MIVLKIWRLIKKFIRACAVDKLIMLMIGLFDIFRKPMHS